MASTRTYRSPAHPASYAPPVDARSRAEAIHAFAYAWNVAITDSVGVSTRTWGGLLAFRTSWAGQADFHSTGHGNAYFWVDNSYSYADTLLQGLCFPAPGLITSVYLG